MTARMEPLKEPPEEYPLVTSAAEVNDKDDRAREQVRVPEWKLTVEMLAPMALELDRFEQESLREKPDGSREVSLLNARARLVALCAVKPGTTEKLWPKRDDARKLGHKSSMALGRLVSVAKRLSGLDDEDIEDIVKNSERLHADDGPCDSPEDEGCPFETPCED